MSTNRPKAAPRRDDAYSEAIDTLTRMHAAAPPIAAARIEGVLNVLHGLYQDNQYLNSSLTELYDAAGMLPKPQTGPLVGGDAASGDEVRYRVENMHANDPMAGLLLRVRETLVPILLPLRSGAFSLEQGELGRILPEQREALIALRERADAAIALMNAVSDIVQLQQGAFEVRISRIRPEDLVRAAAAQLNAKLNPADVRFTIEIDPDLPAIAADFALTLVILNDLLDNALHYTPYGGAIRLTVASLGTHILFTVEDNGIGLTKDDLAQVGQPFWRALHQPLVRQRAGTGLRLYLAQQVVSLMQGELLFSSDEAMGSSFSILLPVAAPRPPGA
jgi:signal transduction histidine kinase